MSIRQSVRRWRAGELIGHQHHQIGHIVLGEEVVSNGQDLFVFDERLEFGVVKGP